MVVKYTSRIEEGGGDELLGLVLISAIRFLAPEGEIFMPQIELAKPVESVDLPVMVKGLKGVISIWLEMEFDPDKLSVEGIYYSDLTKGMMRSDNVKGGRVLVAIAGVKPRDLDGELLSIRFKLLNVVAEGDKLEVRFVRAEFNEGGIDVRARDGLIKIGKPSSLPRRSGGATTWGRLKRGGSAGGQ